MKYVRRKVQKDDSDALQFTPYDSQERGRKGSTGVTRIRSHVVVPSPRKKAETNTNANNELALAA
jgi:hypothetical protein